MRRLLFSLCVASATSAAGLKGEPAGESRKDPSSEREQLQHDRREVVQNRRDKMVLRLNLAGISESDLADLLHETSNDPVRRRELGRRVLLAAGRSVPGATRDSRKDSMEWLQRRVSQLRGKRAMERVNIVRASEDRRRANLAAIRYDPAAPSADRLKAMADEGVPSSRENWQAWIEVSKTDSDPLVRRQAELRAIAASPCLQVTRDYTEPYQLAFAKMDPSSIQDRRVLMGLSKRFYGHDEWMRNLPVMDDTAVAIADKLLALYPEAIPADGSLRERAWAMILNAGNSVTEYDFKIFDGVDFSSPTKAMGDLRALAAQYPDSANVASLVRSIRWMILPPARGSFEALVRRRLEGMPLDSRHVLERGLEPHFANPNWSAIESFLADKALNSSYPQAVAGLRSDIAFLLESKQHNVDLSGEVREALPAASPKSLAALGIEAKSNAEARYQRLSLLQVTDASFSAWLDMALNDASPIVRDTAREKIRQFDEVWLNRYVQGLRQNRTGYFISAFNMLVSGAPQAEFRDFRDPTVAKDLRKRVEELRVSAQTVGGLAGDLERDLAEELDYLLRRFTPYGE